MRVRSIVLKRIEYLNNENNAILKLPIYKYSLSELKIEREAQRV